MSSCIKGVNAKQTNSKYEHSFLSCLPFDQLDEADSMIEEGGHRANSLLIKKNLHKKCQNLFFSATFPPEVVSFAAKMVENPDRILIEEGDEFLVRSTNHMLYFLSHFIATHPLLCCHAIF